MHPMIRALAPLRPLREPVFICAFAGRGSGSAAAAVQYLVDQWHATPIAELDAEENFDFTVRRPSVRLDDGKREIHWPTNTFYVASPPDVGRDFVLLPGIEPHLRWRGFTEAVIDCLRELGCNEAIVLGSRSGALPHTRPVPLRLVTMDEAFGPAFDTEPQLSNREGPTGLITVLSVAFERARFRTATLTAMTPFYVSAEPNPNAVSALAQAIDRAYGSSTSLDALQVVKARVDQSADDALAQSAELRAAVTQLEQQYDWARGNGPLPKSGVENTDASPTAGAAGDASDNDEATVGGDMFTDLDRFLREQREPPAGSR